jgi:hypothetical protein
MKRYDVTIQVEAPGLNEAHAAIRQALAGCKLPITIGVSEQTVPRRKKPLSELGSADDAVRSAIH